MRKVERFEARDGSEFCTQTAALAYERLCASIDWYEENKLYGHYEGCCIEWKEFYEWSCTNRIKLREIVEDIIAISDLKI